MSDIRPTIVSEHLWFTLTTITVNGYIVCLEDKTGISKIALIAASIVITLFALYLILDRAVCYFNNDQSDESKKIKYYHNYKRIIRFNPFTAIRFIYFKEFSGAAFYFLLVLCSCIAVVLSKIDFHIFSS